MPRHDMAWPGKLQSCSDGKGKFIECASSGGKRHRRRQATERQRAMRQIQPSLCGEVHEIKITRYFLYKENI